MSTADAVLAVNERFYDAFARHDADAMEVLWAERAMITCTHPGWLPLFGRAAVLESWREILTAPGAPSISCSNAVAHMTGRKSAFVVCIESLPGGTLAATNAFVLEDDQWRLVHHHAGPVAAIPASDIDDDETIH